MYRIRKAFTFEASHRLPTHPGKCRNLHGHSYGLEVFLQSVKLNRQGMVTDFGDISRVVKATVLDCLDHHHLNDVMEVEPTAEALCKWIYDRLKPWLPTLYMVHIAETATSGAEYLADDFVDQVLQCYQEGNECARGSSTV